jgi:hypothetical protein
MELVGWLFSSGDAGIYLLPTAFHVRDSFVCCSRDFTRRYLEREAPTSSYNPVGWLVGCRLEVFASCLSLSTYRLTLIVHSKVLQLDESQHESEQVSTTAPNIIISAV